MTRCFVVLAIVATTLSACSNAQAPGATASQETSSESARDRDEEFKSSATNRDEGRGPHSILICLSR